MDSGVTDESLQNFGSASHQPSGRQVDARSADQHPVEAGQAGQALNGAGQQAGRWVTRPTRRPSSRLAIWPGTVESKGMEWLGQHIARDSFQFQTRSKAARYKIDSQRDPHL